MDEVKDIRESNASYAKTNDTFKKCCELVGIPATKRQASKFRGGTGRAYAQKNNVK